MKRMIVSVRWSKAWRCWNAHVGTGFAGSLVDFYSKRHLIREARRYARARPPSQLRVFNKNGRIAFEATYGSDPRRHKG